MRGAIVTGAARGIGRAITFELMKRGYAVAGLDVDQQALADLESRVSSADDFLPLVCDVSDEGQVKASVERAVHEFGDITALVNNAGLPDPYFPPLEELEYEQWRRVLSTNLDGIFLCCKHALPSLRRARGAVVNLASTRALQSEPNGEAYCASKGAILSFSHALAISAGPAVRVNSVSPGWIETSEFQPAAETGPLKTEHHEQHPVGRVGKGQDIAALCAFLLSDEAAFITGQNFVADGGMTRKMIYVD